MQGQVLPVALEVVRDIDLEAPWVHSQPPVVKEAMDVAAKEKPTVLVVDAELCVAVEMARLEDARRGSSGESADFPECAQQVVAEPGLSSPDSDNRKSVTPGYLEARRPLRYTVNGSRSTPGRSGFPERIPSKPPHAQLALGRIAQISQFVSCEEAFE